MCSIMVCCGYPADWDVFLEGFQQTLSRGPDESRIIDTGSGLMAFHRLSIMGLTPSGMQPFELNGSWVVCNGELYGFHSMRTMLEEKGYDSINVKTLAARLGCSTQPIYLSFRNMDDLRQAIANAAVQEFVSFMHEDNEHAAHLYGMGYIRFAQEHANLFRFLFMRENAYTEMKNALSPIIETAVQNLMSEYGCSHEKAEWIHDQLWMHSHGIASMIATGFCDWDMEKVSRMVKEAQDNVFQQ